MQDLINQITESAKGITPDADSFSEIYDQYAPALYGRIMAVVKQKEMAEKILERVFINALVDKSIQTPAHLTLFTSLINHSRKKTYSTLKALKVLELLRCTSRDNLSVA